MSANRQQAAGVAVSTAKVATISGSDAKAYGCWRRLISGGNSPDAKLCGTIQDVTTAAALLNADASLADM